MSSSNIEICENISDYIFKFEEFKKYRDNYRGECMIFYLIDEIQDIAALIPIMKWYYKYSTINVLLNNLEIVLKKYDGYNEKKEFIKNCINFINKKTLGVKVYDSKIEKFEISYYLLV